jgi:hypothetical protein
MAVLGVAFLRIAMLFHMHMVAGSTWSYVSYVQRIAYCTPKQALKNKPKTEQSFQHTQPCGNRKNRRSTQRTKIECSLILFSKAQKVRRKIN